MVTVTWTSAVPFDRCKQLLLEIPLLADARCQLFPLDPPVPEAERVGLPVNGIRVFAQSTVLPDRRRRLAFRYKLVPREPCVLRAAARAARVRPVARQSPDRPTAGLYL